MCRKLIYLVSFVVLLGLANDASAEIPRDPNLVIYYSYEDVGAIVPDESGRGHHGTVCGDVSAAPSGIKWYGAAEFQGIWGPTGYSYLDLDSTNYPAEDIPKSAITLAAWCKCSKTGQHHALMSTRASDNTWVMHPQINDNETFRWLLRSPGGTTIFNLNNVGSHGWDEWIHYTGTYDSVTGKGILYIDGAVCESTSVSPGQLIADWGTGARVGYNIDNARPFTGIMDELYLYTRALSQAEIQDLMVSDGLPTEKASHPWPANGAELDTEATDLMWLPGAYAVSNDVYFGESFEDVSDGTGDTLKGNPTEGQFTVADLAVGTTYYWRIDGVNPTDPNSPWKGDIWSFLLRPETAWKPNPSDGANWIDPTAALSWTPGRGAVMHTVYFGENFDDVNNATVGASQMETTYDPPDALEAEKVYYWRVDEFDQSATTHKGNVWSFTTRGAGSGLKGEYYKGDFDTLLLTRKDPAINSSWGADAPAPEVPAGDFSARWRGELEVPFTADWTFTASCKEWVRLWVDGQLLFDKWGQQGGVEWIGIINLAAGQKYSIVMEYYAGTSDAYAILYWNSPSWLSPYQPKQVIPQGAFSMPLMASNPRPANGATDVRDAPILSWVKGDTADKHDVYFGIDQAAVEGATTETADIYRGRQDPNLTTYTPAEAPLEWGQTYYWRIDEVEADGTTVHKGKLCSFTVGEFVTVDDFETYNDIDPPDPASHTIFQAWSDGYGTANNGALVGNDLRPYTERTNVHGGGQAMPLSYNNLFMFSEATLTLTTSRDWTREDVVNLSLWFRGLATNVPEQMYVVLNDTAVVYHTDPAAVQMEGWTEWVIPLQELAGLGVDLTNVTSIAIGFGARGNTTVAGGAGQVFIDDIRLVR